MARKQIAKKNYQRTVKSRKAQLAEALRQRKRNTKETLAEVLTAPEPVAGPSTEPITNVSSSNIESTVSSDSEEPNLRLSDFEKSEIDLKVADEEAPKYKIIDTSRLESFIGTSLSCITCNTKTVTLSFEDKFGFVSKMTLHCSTCAEDINHDFTSKKLTNSIKIFDVNRRMCQAFLGMGEGHNSMEKFAMVMNMNCLSSNSFSQHVGAIYKSTKVAAILGLVEARKKVRDFQKALDPSITDTTVIDLAVSFDGTWHKRGHSSLFGAGVVIHIETGLILDFAVVSRYCHECALTIHDLGEESPEFHMWYQGHKTFCSINYEGSAPAMEIEEAGLCWKNSLNFNFRYTTMLSDGDSKVFIYLSSQNYYGPNHPIIKEECTNHVSKRLGTGLRNVVKSCKAQKITLGGKGFGSLKESTITKLTKYYTNAILSNRKKSVEDMRQAVLATLHHCTSTDAEPRHSKCPKGTDSWCFYNRAVAENESPKSHAEMVRTPINKVVLKHIAPIYQRLSDPALLERCKRGKTQNLNESLHSLLWSKCDKTKNASKRLVEMAVSQAVTEFNSGSIAVINTMKKSGLSPGAHTVKLGRRKDQRRKRRIAARKSLQFQRRRRHLKMKKLKQEEKKKDKEGVTYGAGQF